MSEFLTHRAVTRLVNPGSWADFEGLMYSQHVHRECVVQCVVIAGSGRGEYGTRHAD
jgi:hypothetical protein